MNEPYVVVCVQHHSTHKGYEMMQRDEMDYRGRGRGENKDKGREAIWAKQGKQDSKAIIGLEKAFHPKPHTQIYTRLFPAYKNSIHTHTHTRSSFFIAHSHTYSELPSNKCTPD